MRRFRSFWAVFVLVFLALFIGLTSYFYYKRPISSAVSFHFPSNSTGSFLLNATVSYDDERASGTSQRGQWTLEATLRWQSTLFGKGCRCRLFFDSFSLKDEEKRLVMAYERLDDNRSHHYHCDPRFSSKERLAIFNAFAVDISDSSVDMDDSFFQQWTDLFLLPEGKIGELQFSSRLRSILLNAIGTLKLAPVLIALVNNPQDLPALFSSSSDGLEWITQGNLPHALLWKHRLVEKTEQAWTIETTSVKPKEANNLWANRARPSKTQEGSSQWHLRWTYEPEKGCLQHLEGSWSLSSERQILSSADHLHCHAQWTVTHRD